MSQRLHIGKTENTIYDCVIENDDSNVYEKLISEWFDLHDGFYFGPWKIIIGDIELFYKIEPIIIKVFKRFNKKYPDDIWMFYQGNRNIEHPTKKELLKWIKQA